MKKIFLYTILIFTFSCQEKNNNNLAIQYFDTTEFVQNEISELLKQNFKVTKTIVLNGNIEILKNDDIDSLFLYKEFQYITKANINKPALLGFYKVDSTWQINSKTLADEMNIIYSCDKENSRMKTRMMEVNYSEIDEVDYLFLLLENKNFLHAYSKELSYEKNKAIKLKAWEKTVFQDTLFYETVLEFVK